MPGMTGGPANLHVRMAKHRTAGHSWPWCRSDWRTDGLGGPWRTRIQPSVAWLPL